MDIKEDVVSEQWNEDGCLVVEQVDCYCPNALFFVKNMVLLKV